MKTIAILVKRIGLLLAIYYLDITISGQTECLQSIRDPILSSRIELARSRARRERTRLRGEYNATLPAGLRRTWRMA